MSDHFRRRRSHSRRMPASFCGADPDSFPAAHLAQLGYAGNRVQTRLRLVVAQFTWWLVPSAGWRSPSSAPRAWDGVLSPAAAAASGARPRRGDVATLNPRSSAIWWRVGVRPRRRAVGGKLPQPWRSGIRYRGVPSSRGRLAPSTPGHYWTIVHSFLRDSQEMAQCHFAELTARRYHALPAAAGRSPKPRKARSWKCQCCDRFLAFSPRKAKSTVTWLEPSHRCGDGD